MLVSVQPQKLGASTSARMSSREATALRPVFIAGQARLHVQRCIEGGADELAVGVLTVWISETVT